MKDLLSIERIKNTPMVKEVTNIPHGKLNRLQVKFNNGLGLSIIEGKSAITDQERPYEIAIFDKTGLFTQEYTDDCDADDIVIGYCDVDKVMHYLNKISTIII